MAQKKNLHIFNARNIFSKDFILFLKEHDFDLSEHYVFHYGKPVAAFRDIGLDVTFCSLFSLPGNLKLLALMRQYDRIIIHCLASPWLLFYLYLFPSLCKKVYWVIWGKDLYYYKLLRKKNIFHYLYEFFRKRVFRCIPHVVTIEGDYQLAREWYGVNAVRHESFMYPNTLFKEYSFTPTPHTNINILVGNSADPSNQQEEIFAKLLPYRKDNICIITPLSYGDRSHAAKTIALGRKMFAEKYRPLESFMPYEEYMQVLTDIDIAIFHHPRQQAFSNIVTMLSMGKKVYIRSDQPSWRFFEKLGVRVFDSCGEIELTELSDSERKTNIEQLRKYFSEENYIRGLKEVLL